MWSANVIDISTLRQYMNETFRMELFYQTITVDNEQNCVSQKLWTPTVKEQDQDRTALLNSVSGSVLAETKNECSGTVNLDKTIFWIYRKLCYILRRMDMLGTFSAIFTKAYYFCDFLFAHLYTYLF